MNFLSCPDPATLCNIPIVKEKTSEEHSEKKKHLKHKNLVQELANPPFQSILGWMKKLSNTSKHIDLAPKKQKNLTTS